MASAAHEAARTQIGTTEVVNATHVTLAGYGPPPPQQPTAQAFSEITVSELCERYKRHACQQHSERWKYEAAWYLKRFCSLFGDLPISQMRRLHLDEFLEANPGWESPSTRSSAIRVIKRVFNWAVEREYIASNPFASCKCPRFRKRKPAEVDHIVAILRACRHLPKCGRELGRILMFLVHTGARTKEARKIEIDMLVLDDPLASAAVMHEHKTSDKTDAPRIIAMEPSTRRLVINILRKRNAGGFLFLNHRGQPWTRNALNQAFRRARRLAGVPEWVTPYTFRHYWCTTAVNAGVGERSIANCMGHAKTDMVAHYSQASRVHVKSMVRTSNEVRKARRAL